MGKSRFKFIEVLSLPTSQIQKYNFYLDKGHYSLLHSSFVEPNLIQMNDFFVQLASLKDLEGTQLSSFLIAKYNNCIITISLTHSCP